MQISETYNFMRIESGSYKYIRYIAGLFCIACVLLGCTTDVFNAEKVKATYQDRFPVKDIDPEMDWKMTTRLPVDITVNEDWGTDYTVRVYTANPLDPISNAKLLGEGTANQDLHFTTIIDYPSTLQTLYVARIDAKGRISVKPVDISDGQLFTNFGRQNKGKTRTKASTRFIGEECPYTEAEIEEMLAGATEYDGKKELSQGIYKTSKKNVTGLEISENPSGNIILIVAAGTKLGINKETIIPDNVQIIVEEGGSIALDGSPHALHLTGNSSLVVLGNYSNDGDSSDANIYSNGHGGIWFENTGINYNSGIISVNGDITINAGTTFHNYGKLESDKTIGGESGIIVNHCYILCDAFTNAFLDMYPASYLSCNTFIPGPNATLTMRDNSFINIKGTSSLECDLKGPSTDGEQALFRLASDIENGTGSCTGYIHFETDASAPNLIRFIENGDGQSDLSKVGHANVYIEASPCNGNTDNQPVEQPDENLPDEAMPYTYVFEDNYPLVGDYDFNDVVLDVTTEYKREKKTNNIRAIQLNITLAAAGAGKAVGAGLRIVGITPDDILQITSGGDKSSFHDSFNSPYNLFNFDAGTLMEGGTGSEVVIPIAGEVHDVLGEEVGTLINTGAQEGTTAKARTYEVIIELKDQSHQEPLFSKDNQDFFICYQYKHMQPRMEVHLYEFWDYGATTYGTMLEEKDQNLDLAGNNTWAVCVPYLFRYPLETVNISITSDPSAGAYPLFIDWAKNKDTNQDWYNYPNENKVYR